MTDILDDAVRLANAWPLHESIESFEANLARHVPEGLSGNSLNRIYRKMIPRWHFAMLNDVARNQAFSSALQALTRSGDLVLDVGAGSGLLAMMAVRAGARAVVSCEVVEPVTHIARRIIEANGLADRISIVPKRSSLLTLGQDLPARADLLVTETVDCGLVGEGLLPIIRHARAELLKEDARIIPARAKVFFSLLESSVIHRINFAKEAAGFDVSLFNRFSTQEYFPVRISTWDHALLSPPVEALSFDFRHDALEPQTVRVSVTPSRSGVVHGVLFWFELDLGGGILLSNAPENLSSHWMQAVQGFEMPLRVEAGRPLCAEINQGLTSIHFALTP
ncbi:SAM-dependent methyltransferase [Corallococcus sp. Z5C101001]|nr:50S ribosomal protein L11 methyltransferase [Corallococcus silvisoli]NBD08495.1 SAM-dependent methyltransferase [Corallococcus silvisoli]TSC34560.1 SAM-dependent methyltransferase [Corallococcus sp. Z5C101001]